MPFDPDSVVGKDCHFYYNTGTRATPVWVLIARAQDVSVDMPKDEAEQKSRESGWKGAKGTFKALEFNFGYDYQPGVDPVYAFLRAAFVAGDVVEYWAADGPAANEGSAGWRAPCELFGIPMDQAMEESASIEITAKYTRVREGGNLVEPVWYEVPGD